MIETIIEYLIELISSAGYLGVGISMAIESFFAPIPSELIMPFAGFLASRGEMDLYLVILVGGFASYLGSLPFYLLGYLGNDLIINKFIAKYGKYLFIKKENVEKGYAIFEKYGKGIVLVGRVIPIIRTVISFPAGLAKMNFFEFSIFTLFGSTIWSGFLAFLGFLFASEYERVLEIMSTYENIIFITAGVLVLLYILFLLKKRMGKKD